MSFEKTTRQTRASGVLGKRTVNCVRNTQTQHRERQSKGLTPYDGKSARRRAHLLSQRHLRIPNLRLELAREHRLRRRAEVRLVLQQHEHLAERLRRLAKGLRAHALDACEFAHRAPHCHVLCAAFDRSADVARPPGLEKVLEHLGTARLATLPLTAADSALKPPPFTGFFGWMPQQPRGSRVDSVLPIVLHKER